MLPLAAMPVLATPAAEFWNTKKPEDWTPEEVQDMLTRSPWAKEASVSVFGGSGGALLNRDGATSWEGGMSGSGRQRTRTTQTKQSGDAPDLHYRAILRWESALPIREALKAKAAAEFAEFYVLALVSDLALADPDADEAQRESRLDMMKQYTKLEKHGGAIALANVAPVNKVGTMFYFPRSEPIKDGQVSFTTKLGPVEVKCKFTVKDMMYRGKLEL